MSAAFDIVDHSLLLEKLGLYGFDDSAVGWIRSYLSGREQCVSIDGSMSNMLQTPTGVPQGSILGPILNIFFTNELPDIIQDHLGQDGAGDGHQHCGGEDGPAFTIACTVCGSIYAVMLMIPPILVAVRIHKCCLTSCLPGIGL